MLAKSHIYQDRVLCWYLRVNPARASPQGCHVCFMDEVYELPTSAPTMPLTKPSQKEGQNQWQFPYLTWACSFSPGNTPALTVPTVGGNLGTEGATAPLAPTPSSPSQNHLPWQRPGEGCRRINSRLLHYLNPWGGFATNLKQVLS